ncbi:MAG TPA: DUF2164 domain-containing protein [Gemmatimonadaceae bacterium]
MRGKPPVALSEDARKHAIASIRRFFQEELDQDVGDLKASLVLDYFLTEVGASVYNTAIADAKAFFTERAADLGALCYREEFMYWPSESRRAP